MLIGLFVLLGAVPPAINAMSNPRIATLHGADIVGLVASAWCFGFGVALLITGFVFRGE
jgi:hypothetical protein